LFAQFIIRSNGHQALYLGQDLPFESLGEVVNYYEPDFVFTVLTIANTDMKIEDTISKIIENTGNISLILAGAQIAINQLSDKPNTTYIKNIQEFIDQVTHLNHTAT
ncbi:MAG: hypothetical protein H7098_02365, partial [Oligoflexus sp.]|nr:hypothetical protein [Pseudopedobacter sp.]